MRPKLNRSKTLREDDGGMALGFSEGPGAGVGPRGGHQPGIRKQKTDLYGAAKSVIGGGARSGTLSGFNSDLAKSVAAPTLERRNTAGARKPNASYIGMGRSDDLGASVALPSMATVFRKQ